MGLSNQYECNIFLDNYLGFLNQETADELAHYCPEDSPQSTTLACVCNLNGSLAQHVKHLLLTCCCVQLATPHCCPCGLFWGGWPSSSFSASFPWQLGQTTHQWPIKKGPFILLWLLGLGLMVSLLHFSSSKEAYGKRKFDSLNQDILTFIS